jgi:hypothetical protein
MIGIAFSALSRLCLNRRLPTFAKLEAEILALVRERHDKRIKIHWQFSIQSARTKLNSHYRRLLPVNDKFQKLRLLCTKATLLHK